MRVYVAAPHQLSLSNIGTAVSAANQLLDAGYTPICVHAETFILQIIQPRLEQKWLEYGLKKMFTADVVLRLPGASKGADEEVRVAREKGIPVFEGSVDEFIGSDFASLSKVAPLSSGERDCLNSARPPDSSLDSAYQRPPIVGCGPSSKTQGIMKHRFVEPKGW